MAALVTPTLSSDRPRAGFAPYRIGDVPYTSKQLSMFMRQSLDIKKAGRRCREGLVMTWNRVYVSPRPHA